MSVRVQNSYDYIAHIQKDDGTVSEITGMMQDYNAKLVYDRLLAKAIACGGWLVSQHICLQDADADLVAASYPTVPIKAAEVNPQVASIFGDTELFGTYTPTYKGASLCTYKETW